MAESKSSTVRELITERYGVCTVLPRGALTAIAEEVGLSRERVRQIAARDGRRGTNTTPNLGCAECGAILSYGTKGALCRSCIAEKSIISIVCDGCGVTFQRGVKSLVALQGGSSPSKRGRYSGAVYCGHVCPGRPAGFSVGLTEEWAESPDRSEKFMHAVYVYWRIRGRRVQYETRADGTRWFRLRSEFGEGQSE